MTEAPERITCLPEFAQGLTARAPVYERAFVEYVRADLLAAAEAERDAARAELAKAQPLIGAAYADAARTAYVSCAETRHVRLGDKAAAAILARTPADAAAAYETAKREAYREGWRFAHRQCVATGSVPDPDALIQEPTPREETR
jgi:hypothetical protein